MVVVDYMDDIMVMDCLSLMDWLVRPHFIYLLLLLLRITSLLFLLPLLLPIL
jgi:hypothetical protein